MNKFGWVKQEKDTRDLKSLRYKEWKDYLLPPEYQMPIKIPVYDQGQLGSCTANSASVCFLHEVAQKHPESKFNPSRLFLYYNSRAMRGWEKEDSGAIIRDVFKSMNVDGICSEFWCKYRINRFDKKPSIFAYSNAKKHMAIVYASVEKNIERLKQTVFSGACVSFGFNVYMNFQEGNWDSSDGIMPFPSGTNIGGHAVTIVGWSDLRKCFLIQNSWGTNWGQGGYFWMPYAFMVSNETSDFWCIEQIK